MNRIFRKNRFSLFQGYAIQREIEKIAVPVENVYKKKKYWAGTISLFLDDLYDIYKKYDKKMSKDTFY